MNLPGLMWISHIWNSLTDLGHPNVFRKEMRPLCNEAIQLTFGQTNIIMVEKWKISMELNFSFVIVCSWHNNLAKLPKERHCPKCSANPIMITPIWKWQFENKEHLIRGLYMTFFEKFLFKFPFSHKWFQMGQKMYFYQLNKL